MDLALPALVAGLLFAWLAGQAYYPLALRVATLRDCDCGTCCEQCGHYPGCTSGKGRSEDG